MKYFITVFVSCQNEHAQAVVDELVSVEKTDINAEVDLNFDGFGIISNIVLEALARRL